MLRAKVNGQVCRACQPCPARRVCRIKALMLIDDDERLVVDLTRCRGCGDCLGACPYAAIAMQSAGWPGSGSLQPTSA